MKFTLQLYSYGGVCENTVDSLFMEIGTSQGGAMYSRISGDALISRSRSRGLSRFLKQDDFDDVLVMVDHDLQWQAGAAKFIAQQAYDKNAIVGGIYSKRNIGAGFSSRLPQNQQFLIGGDDLVEVPYVATGFMAIPKTVALEVLAQNPLDDLHLVTDGFTEEHQYYNFFSCMVTEHTLVPDMMEYLSEDWAFCKRATAAGCKVFASSHPKLTHYGEYGFTPMHATLNLNKILQDAYAGKMQEEKAS